jgi:hypothetical protein
MPVAKKVVACSIDNDFLSSVSDGVALRITLKGLLRDSFTVFLA